MKRKDASPIASDKMKKAVQAFCELLEIHPHKSRLELLRRIELQYDLSPLESEFLNKQLLQGK